MDFNKAIKLLQLKNNFTIKELKQAYHKQALLYHPDKNSATEEEFKKIKMAYDFLHKKKNGFIPEQKTFFQIVELMRNIFYKNNYLEIFLKKIKKEKMIQILSIIIKYQKILNISNTIISKITEVLKEKMKNDKLFILNPSIDDLINDIVYKLKVNEEIFFCPLWADKLYFHNKLNDIIVKCIPEITDNIIIDKYNNIIVKKNIDINTILKKEKLYFNIGKKEFIIPSKLLQITKYQEIILKEKGLLKFNKKDIYDNSKRSNIFVEITLH
ncbi:DnaJ domain-containing protein [bacterium]|nr:DnaJ domain-containing protein [bacterium]